MAVPRDLVAASTTPLVLAILSGRDSYGYEIIQQVKELSGHTLEWTDGMLYPVLHRLEEHGYVEAYWRVADSGRRRKYYRILSAGIQELSRLRRHWESVNATLRRLWDEEGAG
jgi:DNA-binding PadR family transcriptional regulator